MFAISVHLGQPGEVILEPSTERFLQVFRHLYEDLISVAEGVPCIASALSLASHAPSAAGRSLSEVLASHRPWSCCLEATEKKLTAQLREAQRLSLDTYEPYRKILNYKQAWNEASFAAQNHSLASLSQEVDLMNQFQEQLQRFRAQRHVGVLVIEGRELREELAAVPGLVLAAVWPLLQDTARARAAALLERLQTLNQELDERPDSLPALQAYARAVEIADKEELSLEAGVEEVQQAQRLLRKRVRVLSEDSELLEKLLGQLLEFASATLPAAKGFLTQKRREQTFATSDVLELQDGASTE
ncbi:unnamed protein product [Effrenium voratum]|nr:unnamed protein product [Effrenium voratum]